jgi:hypothetical protein
LETCKFAHLKSTTSADGTIITKVTAVDTDLSVLPNQNTIKNLPRTNKNIPLLSLKDNLSIVDFYSNYDFIFFIKFFLFIFCW